MLRKRFRVMMAMAILGAVLAGCSDAGTVQRTSEETLKEQTDEGTTDQDVQSDAGEEEEEQSGESTKVDNVMMEEIKVDPMELKDSYQRAAFFADWVYAQKKENTLVSPLSLNLALGLAAEGASGETAKELYQYLGREDYADYVKQYLDFAEGLATEKGERQFNENYSFHYEIANSIWVNQKNRLIEDYRKAMEEKFRAEVAPADFEGDASGSVKKINSWCEEKTHGMIPKIVEVQNIKPQMKAILINSLYFESPWVEKWGKTEHEFTGLSGKKVTQEMLSGKGDLYYENDQAIAFGKSYYNGFQFIGILPKAEGEFSVLDLDLKGLLETKSTDYTVMALMPKLNYETSAEAVEEILMAQGLVTPFDSGSAQFDQMIEGDELHISQIIQKCKIELDENGTKAAAVTAIMMRANSIAPMEKKIKEVYLDRPFAYLIYDSVNDEIVFVGKVTEME